MSEVIPEIVAFSSASAEISNAKLPPDRLLAGDPTTTTRNFFSDPDGVFFAGIWESTRGRWRVTYSEYEFCHITRGRVRIEGPSGQRWEFGPGDTFVIPAGFAGVWDVIEPMAKLYVIFEPKSA